MMAFPAPSSSWYKIINPSAAKPTLLQGPVIDSAHSTNFLFMPSVATNNLGNLQFTFEESGDTAHPPSLTVAVTFFTGLGGTGAAHEGPIKQIIAGQGDEQDSEVFGEYYRPLPLDSLRRQHFLGDGRILHQLGDFQDRHQLAESHLYDGHFDAEGVHLLIEVRRFPELIVPHSPSIA